MKKGNVNRKVSQPRPTLKDPPLNRRPSQAEMEEFFRIEATPEELVQALIKHSPKRS